MQGVLVFANATARDAAITSPQEGQFAFTKDNDSLWYYSGSAWVSSGATGDIEGVTAGTGISGGGTSGTVTVTNSMATAIDAKGDLIVGTGADTFARLGVGTNGHTIVADSAEATGLKWAAPAGGGKVLQVVQGTLATKTSINTTTPTDTGLQATITPSAATSKILITVSIAVYLSRTSGTYNALGMKILRGGTTVVESDNFAQLEIQTAPSFLSAVNVLAYSYLDSPSTTSATTYKLQGYSRVPSQSHWNQLDTTSTATILLTEIGA
jgi:hypothetical protein